MNQKQMQLVAIILRELASQIETLRMEDIEGILDKSKKFEIKVIASRGLTEESKVNKRSTEDLLNASKALHKMSTRDEGIRFLKENYGTRAELVLLSKTIDVPVHKTDTVEMVIEKIVEATIGFRTRSAAVQGNSDDNKI